MPPKGSRGVRGKSATDNDNSTTDTGATPEANTSVPTNAALTHQNEAEPQASTSHNSAPPAASTRLDSIKSSATSSPRGRKGPVAKPKFVGRRSQAARAELEREEAAKKAAEASQNSRKQKRPVQGCGGDRGGRGRGRGGRGRGRGGFTGDLERQPVASGPFSSGQVTQDIRSGYGKRSGWGISGGGGNPGVIGGGGGSQSRSWSTGGSKTSMYDTKFEGSGEIITNTMGRMRSVKTEDGGYISSDDEDLEGGVLRKQDIDELQNHVVDLTGTEVDSSGNPFAPVRLPRMPVKDRKVGLSAEEVSKRSAEDDSAANAPDHVTEKRRGKAKAHDVEITGSTQRPKPATAYSSSSDTEDKAKIKIEPTDDEPDLTPVDMTTLTTLPDPSTVDSQLLKDPPSSPESRRKAKDRIKTVINAEHNDDIPFERPKTPSYPTQQEVDEFHRKWNDRATIFAELGQMPSNKTAPQTATDREGDVQMADSSAEKSVRDDQVYLFQFPSLLPDLYALNVKSDPDVPERGDAHDEAMHMDQEDKVSSKEGAKMRLGETQPGDALPHLASGLAGKLRIHKSGRAYLDWGGKNTLMLELGTPSMSLQNVMLARFPDTKPDAESEQQSDVVARAMGLGEVKQKFVMIPKFD